MVVHVCCGTPKLIASERKLTIQEDEAKAKEPKKDPLEEYCEDNPETDECRYAQYLPECQTP